MQVIQSAVDILEWETLKRGQVQRRAAACCRCAVGQPLAVTLFQFCENVPNRWRLNIGRTLDLPCSSSPRILITGDHRVCVALRCTYRLAVDILEWETLKRGQVQRRAAACWRCAVGQPLAVTLFQFVNCLKINCKAVGLNQVSWVETQIEGDQSSEKS